MIALRWLVMRLLMLLLLSSILLYNLSCHAIGHGQFNLNYGDRFRIQWPSPPCGDGVNKNDGQWLRWWKDTYFEILGMTCAAQMIKLSYVFGCCTPHRRCVVCVRGTCTQIITLSHYLYTVCVVFFTFYCGTFIVLLLTSWWRKMIL